MELRTVQKSFLEKAEQSRKSGNNKGLLIFATGLGKTLASLSDALRLVEEHEKKTQKRGKILILAHNHNLLYQHAKDFKLLCNDRKIGFLYKTKKDVGAEVLFANIMTLKQKKYLNSFKSEEFNYIIVDETHHAGAKSYKCIFDYFKPNFLLGMTATPNRTDQIEILPLYDNNVIYNVNSFEAINKGWLRPYKEVFLWDEFCNYEKIKSYRMKNGNHKYDVKELGRYYNVPERDEAIIKKFKEKAGDRKGVGFCVSVDEARRMADLFNDNGIISVAIWGGSGKGKTMNEVKRNKILKDFEEGKYQMIFNCEIIGEGLHLPSVDVVLKLRPTESSIKNNQQNGRGLYNIEGLKINGNKYPNLLILDFVGNYAKCYANYIYQGRLRENKDRKIRDIRELVELSIGCEVEFEERVIEEFNRQYEKENINGLQRAIEEFKEIYKNKKPFRGQLKKENQWIYNHFLKNNLLDKYCLDSKFKDLQESIEEFKEIYKNKKPFRGQLKKENHWIYEHFLSNNLLDKYCKESQSGKKMNNQPSNIKITSSYTPKNIIIPTKQKRKGIKKTYEGLHKEEYKSKEDKVDIRNKIISKIRDGDKVLLLESPDLSALKEIERLGIKPDKIIIPNHLEFKELAKALQNYKTNLKIECINTSALQYLVDSEEKFDFIWLDYCGAFSYYIKDLDILFQKHFNNMKLVLTYNLFDPAKEDDSYYFTRVIDYVLSKTQGNKVRLINDITYRYKKQMYNLGFNIQENKNEKTKK